MDCFLNVSISSTFGIEKYSAMDLDPIQGVFPVYVGAGFSSSRHHCTKRESIIENTAILVDFGFWDEEQVT